MQKKVQIELVVDKVIKLTLFVVVVVIQRVDSPGESTKRHSKVFFCLQMIYQLFVFLEDNIDVFHCILLVGLEITASKIKHAD